MDFINYKQYECGNDKQQQMYQILQKITIEDLSFYQPRVVGTIPLGLDVESFDIDIICEVNNPQDFIKMLKSSYQDFDNFKLEVSDVVICQFDIEGIPIEIYGENKPTTLQNAYQHMMIEDSYLKKFGASFKNDLITLKAQGLKTEAAFALLLGICGNPYKMLFENKDITRWHNPLKQLSFYEDISKIAYLNKGWSHDYKLIVETKTDKYLVRITPKETLSHKQLEFEQIKQLNSNKVMVPEAIEFISGEVILAAYSWIEGIDLESILPTLSEEEQYKLGFDVGLGLRDLQLESKQFNWYEKYLVKINRNIEWYKTCDVAVDGDDVVIDFLKQHKGCLKNRPITWQHGDYHVGNMIYKDGKIGVVDFNRSSFGDPWEEYDRFVFTWSVSPLFAVGQLQGYFDEIPDNFFECLAVYNASNILAGIPWAIPYGQKEVDVMKKNFCTIYEQYDGFSKLVPKWYEEIVHKINKND